MDYNFDYLKLLKSRVKETRYIHTLGVISEAIEYAKKYNVDLNKARIAASLHDICKYDDEETLKELILRYNSSDEYLNLPVGARHAYAAYGYLKDEVGIDDLEILNAVKYHTTGRINMTTLDKIIYLADFTDPSRGEANSKYFHDLALNNIDLALYEAMSVVLNDLKSKNKEISNETINIFNFYKELTHEQRTRNN